MFESLFAIPVVLMRPAEASRFAPPLDTDLLYVTENEQRGLGAAETERFSIRRTIRFEREGDGFRATLTTLSIDGGIASASGAMFEIAMGKLAERPIILHLDRSGTVTAIDDEARLMKTLLTALATEASAGLEGSERDQAIEQVTGPLATLGTAQRRAMLASMISPLIAPPDLSLLPSPSSPITKHSTVAGPITLTGFRRSWAGATGRVTIREETSGALPEQPDRPAVTITNASEREVNPSSRLIASGETRREIGIGAVSMTSVTRHRLTLPD